MRLDAFLLADHAAVAEGKLYINGGGITRLNVPTIPFVIPTLAVVVRFLIETDDDYGTHEIGIQLESPSGINLFPEGAVAVGNLERGPGMAEGEEQALQLNLNFASVPILEVGVYVLSISLDGDLQRRATLPAVQVESPVVATRPNRAERRRKERERRS